MRNPQDSEFVEDFVARIQGSTGDELTARAKETRPFLKTPMGQLIDLEAYLAERKRETEALSHDQKLAAIVASRTQ